MRICPVCSREFAAGETHCPDDGVALVALSTSDKTRPEELLGKIVEGRYRVERIVGKGGMGTVYAARHVVVGKAVALKVLRAGVEQNEGVLQRFIREAQTTNLLKSRHIVEINDFGQLPNGLFFVVMELLEGMDLTRAMKPSRLSRAELIHIFIQIAEALAGAHEQGIVHRDLKPDNVFLVNEAGDPLFVKLLDFGIAKLLHGDASGLTETGVILGTPYYMSPEQARAEPVDHRTDIYALGVMMYRAFTGRLPFVADSTMGVLTRHLSEAPQPPSKISSVQPKAELLILRCMEKKPEHRPQSMREVVTDLRGMMLEEERRGERRIQEDTTVNALGHRPGIPPTPAVPGAPYPSAAHPGDVASPSGQHPSLGSSGPHPSGAYAGPHQTGPHPSGQHPSGAYGQHPSGAYSHAIGIAATASGQHQTGPHPTYTSAATPPATSYPSGAHRAAMAGPPGAPGSSSSAYGPPSAPPQSGNPAESSVTSLHWPASSGSGATTRGLVTSSAPSPAPSRGMLTMGILSVVMLAAGAIAAFVFFGIRQRGPAQAPADQSSATPSATVAAAPASAIASSSAASAPPPPASAATAEAPPTGTAAAQGKGASHPRGGAVAPPPPPPTAKPSASAPPKRNTSDIRSPFD